MSILERWYMPLVITVVAAMVIPASAQRRTQATAIENGWMFNYHQARQVARDRGKPLMVVFRCVP